MIKHIIFDFDGTIADSRAVFVSVFNRLAQKYQYRKLEPETLEYLRSMSIPERCRYLNVPLYRIPFLASEFLTFYKKETSQITLYKGIRELMETLHTGGYTLSVISSNETATISAFLESHHLHMISGIHSSRSLFGKEKVMKKFLSKNHLKPEEAIYIGDELRDIKASAKAGLKMIWVAWGYDPASLALPEKPDFTASEPADILHILHRLLYEENELL